MIQVFKPFLGEEEIEAVAEVLRSGWIGTGPKTENLEREFAHFVKSPHVLAVNSATAALNLVMAAFVKPGDEVITPSFTFISSTHSIFLAGAVPVFADIDPLILTLDPKDVIRKITPKTRAILVVHYGGQPANLKELKKIAREKHLLLFEDCAHANGSYINSHHVGTTSDAGVFSFAAIKNMTTGDGGMVVSPHKRMINKMRELAWSGISKTTWSRSSKKSYSWKYDVKFLGWKYLMNDIAAAIGLVQLKRMPQMNRSRRQIALNYQKAFKNIPWLTFPQEKPGTLHSFHNFYILVPPSHRNKLIDYLAQKGVATTVHYFPNHRYSLYKKYYRHLPVTDFTYKSIINLPIYSNMTPAEQDQVISAVLSFRA